MSADTLSALSSHLSQLVAKTVPFLARVEGARGPATATRWSDRWFVTVDHVMGSKREGALSLADGGRMDVRIVGRDATLDLCVLEATSALAPPPTFADTDPITVGALALVIGLTASGGTPAPIATLGMVSRTGGAWTTASGGDVDSLIEIDASLPMAARGGALVATDGRLLGMNTPALRRAGATLPRATLERAVVRLLAEGDVRRGRLGIGAQPVVVEREGLDNQSRRAGLVITTVEAGGAAAKAGIVVGDILIACDGVKVGSIRALLRALASRGDREIELELMRGGQTLRVRATPSSVR